MRIVQNLLSARGMVKMKIKIIGIVVALLFIMLDAENITQIVQPGCAYRLSSRQASGKADSLFYNADSSYRPTYYNGNRAICKGIGVTRGTASGVVMVHPNYNTDTTVSYPIYIDSTLDAGFPVPFLFDKIFWEGSTLPMDSIWYFPDIGK